MRLVDFNIEWMNDWFVGGSQVAFKKSNPAKGVSDVDNLAQRVAKIVLDASPDVLTVEEGPSDIREMELFVATYLLKQGQPLYDVFGGLDGASQKVYILVKKGGALKNYQLSGDQNGLKSTWDSDVNGDEVVEPYKFTRLPVVVDGQFANGKKCKIIAMHTKSNFIQNGEDLWSDPATRQQFIHEALTDRRRISAEALRLRMYLDNLVAVDPNALVVVAGDLNDGPGLDYFELRYLTHNVIDLILGSTFDYEMLFRHAFVSAVPAADRYTCEFYDFVEGVQKRLLLDHIALSPALAGAVASSGILHNEYNAALDPSAQLDRQKRPSDHRPVFVDIDE
jgi:hypothetical protein